MRALDRVIVFVAGATVVVLAGVAGAISYSHMAELAHMHGEVGWRAHAFPISVDGVDVVASLVLLAHRRTGARAGWLPWASLVAGTAASVAANVAVGPADLIGRLVAGWPAVALLLSIKLMSGLLDAGSRSGPIVGHSAPDAHDRSLGTAADQDHTGPERAQDGPSEPGPAHQNPGPAGARRTGDHLGDRRKRGAGPRSARHPRAGSGVDVVPLEEGAGVVRDQLVAAGLPVNRRNLAAGLRAAGHRVRNDRLGGLLRLVTATEQGSGHAAALPGAAGGGGDRG